MEPDFSAEQFCGNRLALLSGRDVELLRPLSELIVERRGEIVRHWFRHYALHFGDFRALPEPAFTTIFEQALADLYSALSDGDLGGHAEGVSRLGTLLGAQRMPLEEVIASLQFFKNLVAGVDEKTAPAPAFAAFDRLCQTQITLIVSAYFRSEPAAAGEKRAALEGEGLRLPMSEKAGFHGLVGATPSMRDLFACIAAAGAAGGNVLIVGEGGTGKELVARAVHRCSARAREPFVALNCAAVAQHLIGNELFGYVQNDLGGATSEYLGLLRSADGGTLFLGEITELGKETQNDLLGVLESGQVQPVGGAAPYAVDVRLLASTQRDPQQAIAEGRLLAELYDKLQRPALLVPPLRERREDIPLLAEHFIRIFNQIFGRAVAGIERRALAELSEYNWPGNVGELSMTIEEAFISGTGRLIALEDLSPVNAAVEELTKGSPSVNGESGGPLSTYAEAERAVILRALRDNAGNKVRAAKQLKISRKKLYSKIAKYDL